MVSTFINTDTRTNKRSYEDRLTEREICRLKRFTVKSIGGDVGTQTERNLGEQIN